MGTYFMYSKFVSIVKNQVIRKRIVLSSEVVVFLIEINPLPINTAKEDGIPVQPTSVREACQETDTIIELYLNYIELLG